MEEMQKRIEIIAKNAEARVNEVQQPVGKDAAFYQRFARVPVAPIFIASTEGIGTDRVRCNHVDAAIHYCIEQEALKKAGAPL